MARSVRWRRLCPGATLLVIAAFVYDLARPPARQCTTRALLAALDLYRDTVAAHLADIGGHCRLTPTCSRYASAVIASHGAIAGSWLALRRVARCGPWTPLGTVDPPPLPTARGPRSGVRGPAPTHPLPTGVGQVARRRR